MTMGKKKGTNNAVSKGQVVVHTADSISVLSSHDAKNNSRSINRTWRGILNFNLAVFTYSLARFLAGEE